MPPRSPQPSRARRPALAGPASAPPTTTGTPRSRSPRRTARSCGTATLAAPRRPSGTRWRACRAYWRHDRTGSHVGAQRAPEAPAKPQPPRPPLKATDGGRQDDDDDEARQPASQLGKIVATYDYVDVTGQLLFQVVRFQPKNFRQRRPKGAGWEWGLGDTKPVLYRLLELADCHPRLHPRGREGRRQPVPARAGRHLHPWAPASGATSTAPRWPARASSSCPTTTSPGEARQGGRCQLPPVRRAHDLHPRSQGAQEGRRRLRLAGTAGPYQGAAGGAGPRRQPLGPAQPVQRGLAGDPRRRRRRAQSGPTSSPPWAGPRSSATSTTTRA